MLPVVLSLYLYVDDQVYRGELRGREVAVKVQRPGIREAVAADAALLRAGASLLESSGAVKAEAVAAVDEVRLRHVLIIL